MIDTTVLAVAVPCLVIVFILVERLVNAAFYLVMALIYSGGGTGVYPAMQLYGAFVTSSVGVVTAFVEFFASCSRVVMRWSIVMLVVAVLVTVMFFFYEWSPTSIRLFVQQWNLWLGPMLYYILIAPVRGGVFVVQNCLPVYNFFVRFFIDVLASTGLSAATAASVDLFELSTNLGLSVYLFVDACIAYVNDIGGRVNNCAEMGRSCFEVVELHLENAFRFVGPITQNCVGIVHVMCPLFHIPLDLLVYPLVDPNLPTLLSDIVNLVLVTVVETPRITAQRCRLRRGEIGIVACLPDTHRVVERASAVARKLGVLLDNWLDMCLVITEAAINQQSPACAEKEKRNRTIKFADEYFRGNVTALVGLSQSLFAVTDGSVIQYVDAARTMNSVFSPLGTGWPIQVDPSLGIAAIDGLASGDTPSMLGCRCDDVDSMMRISCGVAQHYEDQGDDTPKQVIDVLFQVPTTASVMTCATTKIAVQSVRWPSVRYTAVDQAPELVAKRRVDAAIWVMPLCLGASLQCAKDAIVTSCFPYCIALHERASTAGSMVLYDAQQWEEYVHIMGRNCTAEGISWLTDGVDSAMKILNPTIGLFVDLSMVTSTVNALVLGSEKIVCYPNPIARSIVPTRMHGSATYKESQNSVRTSEQPFVVAGDTALVGNYDFENSVFTVTAMRIFGNSRNEFTMQRIAKGIPANPPVETLSQAADLFGGEFVTDPATGEDLFVHPITLPYRFSSSVFGLNPAVQTPTGVAYATNPTLHIWQALFEYCKNGVGRTQLIILTKYHPLIVTVVDVGVDTVELAGVVRFDQPGDDAFPIGNGITADICSKAFGVAVTGLELVDSLNIAVSVLYTVVEAGLDPFSDERTHTRIFYINTNTLERRENFPWDPPLPKQPSDENIQLCPALRRMPQLGSIAAEAAVAVTVMVTAPVTIGLAIAGLVPHWKNTTECPLESYGHTTLQHCGYEIFSQGDDFFEALVNANRHFWRSLVYIANLVPLGDRYGGSIRGAVTGLYYLGETQHMPFVASSAVKVAETADASEALEELDAPVKGTIGLFGLTPASFMKNAMLSPLMVAWWVTRVISRTVADVVPHAIHGEVPAGLDAVLENVYNARGMFSNMVIGRAVTSCSGLGMLFGTTNPLARFMVHGCEAPLFLIEGVVDLILTMTVDVGFSACVCYAPTGEDFAQFLSARCEPAAPRHMKPALLKAINGLLNPRDMCEDLRVSLQDRIDKALDPCFTSMFAMTEELGSVFDWLRVWLGDTDAGKCTDFDTDPYIFAVVPEPVDYFRVCGETSHCDLICAGAIANFEQHLLVDGVGVEDDVYSEDVEGLFFTDDTSLSSSSFRSIMALHVSLTCPDSRDATRCSRCVYVLGVQDETSYVVVQAFCVPAAVGMGIVHLSQWVITGFPGSTASMGGFLDESRVVLVNAASGAPGIFVAECAQASCERGDLYSIPPPSADALRVNRLFLQGRDHVLMEYSSDSGNHALCMRLVVEVARGTASLTDVKDCTSVKLALQGSHAVALGGSMVLAIPALPSMTAQNLEIYSIDWLAGYATFVRTVGTTKSFAGSSGISGFYANLDKQESLGVTPRLLAQNSLSPPSGSHFVILSAEDSTTRVNWLAEVRINAASETGVVGVHRTYSRQESLTVRIERQCNRFSCSGCYRRETQLACHVMHQCIIGRCVGTLVNQRRSLCAIGMTARAVLEMGIEAMRAAYMIIAQTAGQVYGFTLGSKTIEATWPDDAFFSFLCVSKDAMAHGVSVLTAVVYIIIESVLKLPIVQIASGALSVDGNLRIIAAMGTQAMTQLLYQVSLMPLYMMIITQKMIVCPTATLLAFTDAFGLEVSFGSKSMRSTTSSTVGECMTDNTAATATSIEEQGERAKLASVAVDVTRNFFATMMSVPVIVIDVAVAYMKGVLVGMEDVAQTLDMAHCKLPDFYMMDVFDCVCGDKPMVIPEIRSREGVDSAAFWCTGTLQMVGSDGQPFIIFNPFSLHDIEAVMQHVGGTGLNGRVYTELEQYLLCLSRPSKYIDEFGSPDDCARLRPYIGELEAQGADTIAVMGRCRANYQIKEWDPGAYAMFTDDAPVGVTSYYRSAVPQSVATCLVIANAAQQGPSACLDEFLSTYVDPRYPALAAGGVPKDLYFSYEYLDESLHNAAVTDACEAFSGPAQTNEKFAACLSGSGTACAIAPFVWSARSNNKVPVAVRHKKTGGSAATREAESLDLLESAYDAMQDAFNRADAWTTQPNSHIVAQLFSVEGDFLHQVFDCAFMGGLDRVDMWPLREMGVPVPSWWRDEAGDRQLKPCRHADLGDDTALPFTCGSETRRAIMKYFVRSFFAETEDSNSSYIVRLVRERIDELKVAYGYTAGDTSNLEGRYACACADGSGRRFECCAAAVSDGYTTPGLNGARFDQIPAENIARLLKERIQAFWGDKIRSDDVDPWWMFLSESEKQRWNWASDASSSSVASKQWVFKTSEDLFFFNQSEVGGPFERGTVGLWHVCTSLLGQRMSSLPLKQNSTGWFLRNTDRLQYDVGAGDLRSFARHILSELDDESPVAALRDWRHAPSPSAVCSKPAPAPPFASHARSGQFGISDAGDVVPLSLRATVTGLKARQWGPGLFRLSDSSECFCGWAGTVDGDCEVPEPVRVALGWASATYPRSDNTAVAREVLQKASSLIDGTICPMLDFSDHWGVLTPAAAAAWPGWGTDGGSMDAKDVIGYGRGGLRVEAWERLVQGSGLVLREQDRAKKLLADDGFDLTTQAFCADKNAPSVPESDLGLFPVAQIVHESMPIAACSRYVIEAAKYEVMSSTTATANSLATIAQQIVVAAWEGRCNAQLHLLSTCRHFEVFEYVPAAAPAAQCPFEFTGGDPATYYVTQPGCIVYFRTKDSFYDPCRCLDCSSQPLTIASPGSLPDTCKLRFDPRSLSQGWGLSVPTGFVRDLFDRIRDDQREGLTFESNEYCEGFVDWWPESWEHPVGYHVTTPCHPDEAGYRTFDNSFRVKTGSSGAAPTIEYEPHALRDPDVGAAYFGTGGLCRKSTYGFPLFELNDLRLCTRRLLAERFDPLSANKMHYSLLDDTGSAFACAPTGDMVPWHFYESRPFPAQFRAVGTIPGLVSPRVFGNMPYAGTVRDSGTSFYTSPRCNDDTDCSYGFRCSRNVCVSPLIGCLTHAECADTKLCNADGRCVIPYVYITNLMDAVVDVQLFAPACMASSSSSSLLGWSRAGQIDDLLQAHGFCGVHEWYDYTSMCPGGACDLGVETAIWENSSSITRTTIWDAGVLAIHPHICDMDYEYSAGRVACEPYSSQHVQRYFATYRGGASLSALDGTKPSVMKVSLMPPPAKPYNKLQFLGINSDEWQYVVPCADIPQCIKINFKWNNQVTPYEYYTDEDIFQCGGGMKLVSGKCKFDQYTVPFWNALCNPSRAAATLAVCNADKNNEMVNTIALTAACSLLNQEWSPQDIRVRGSAAIFNALYSVFEDVRLTPAGYTAASNCATELRLAQATLPSETYQAYWMYYAFEHSLYTLPFSWWFKCSYLKSSPLPPTGATIIKCDEWKNTAAAPWWMQDITYTADVGALRSSAQAAQRTHFDELVAAKVVTKVLLDGVSQGALFMCFRHGIVDVTVADSIMGAMGAEVQDFDCFSPALNGYTYDDTCDLKPDSSVFLQGYPYTRVEEHGIFFEKAYSLTEVRDVSEQPFTGGFATDSQLFKLGLKQPEDWNAWGETYAQPIDQCLFEPVLPYVENGGLTLMTDDELSRVLLSPFGEKLIRTKDYYVLSESTPRSGPYAGILPTVFIEAATLPSHVFYLGEIFCVRTGSLDGSGKRVDVLGWGQSESAEVWYTSSNTGWKETLPCSSYVTPTTANTQRHCRILLEGTRVSSDTRIAANKRARFTCTSAADASNLSPKIEVLRFTDSSGSQRVFIVPVATCVDIVDCAAGSVQADGRCPNPRQVSLKDIMRQLHERIPYTAYAATGTLASSSTSSFFSPYTFSMRADKAPFFADSARYISQCGANPELCECAATTESVNRNGEYTETNLDQTRALYSYEVEIKNVNNRLCSGRNNCWYSGTWVHTPETLATNVYLFSRPTFWNAFESEFSKKVLGGLTQNPWNIVYSWKGIDELSFEYFDTSENRAHDYFIKKDSNNEVKCNPGDVQNIDYGSCAYSDRLQQLRSHVNSAYSGTSNHVLRLNGDGDEGNFAEVMLKGDGAVISWRTTDDTLAFIDDVIPADLDSVCDEGVKGWLETYCYIVDGVATVINPWVGGDYNPVEGCDTTLNSFVRETIDGTCSPTVCTTTTDLENFIEKNPAQQNCIPRHGLAVTARRIADDTPTDICARARAFSDGECPEQHGVFGGSSGTPVSNVYEPSGFTCSTSSFFDSAGVTQLFRGYEVDNACLRMAPEEIGPCKFWLEIQADGKMLSRQAGLQLDTDGETEWMHTLYDACAAETETYQSIYGGEDWTFSTPYERIAFWQGIHARVPVTPDPSRTRVAFSEEEGGCGEAHPLQAPQKPFAAAALGGRVRTADGVCVCSKQTYCNSCGLPSDPARVAAWTTPVHASGGVVSETKVQTFDWQFDWPRAGGVYRDGSTSKELSNPLQIDPRLVSRLPSFTVGVDRTTEPPGRTATGKTTLSEGGDCHMGRTVRHDDSTFDLAQCQLISRTSSLMKFECISPSNVVTIRTLNREISKMPPESVTLMKSLRRKCGQCSVPQFKSEGGLDEAETSFGVPFRFAPSRRVMRELLELMQQYNVTVDWGSEKTETDRKGFVDGVLRGAAERALLNNDDETTLLADLRARFEEPWLFCDLHGCSGGIAYDDWINAGPAARIDMCYEELMKESNNGDDLVVNIELCDIDDQLDEICAQLRLANQSVFDANCNAAGLCVPDTFTYAPGVYSISNNDFVRTTVRNFYRRHDSELCMDADEDTLQLISQNEDEMSECASVQIHVITDTLNQLRLVAPMIARTFAYMFNIGVALFRTLLPNGEQAVHDVIYWFEKLIQEIAKVLLEVAQLVFRLTFNLSPFGQIIRDALKLMCRWLAWILDKLAWLWCNVVSPINKAIISAMQAIADGVEEAINSIPFVSGFKFTVVRNILNLFRDIQNKLNNFMCNGVNIPCDWADPTVDLADGALPVATRCWADFVPFAGIASSLSCSRADTCANDVLSGGDAILCDSCPIQDGVTFNDYGCDLLTKRCTCKTQPRTQTFCSEGGQCSLDATCLLVDNPFTSAAWGVDMCSSCSTQSICVYDGQESAGKCACPFSTPQVEMCSPYSIGDTVFLSLSSSSLCYYTFSTDIQSGATTVVSRDSLAVVPCSIVDPTAVVCVEVSKTPSIVAFRLIDAQPFRRLLTLPLTGFIDNDSANQELAETITLFSDWNRTAEPCRSLVEAHRKEVQLGPVDIYVLRQCIFWRMVGNMTDGVPDTLFLSFEDAIDAVAHDPTILVQVIHSIGGVVRSFLTLWPAARNFVARIAPLLDGRNTSWLVLAQQAMEAPAAQRRNGANQDAFLRTMGQHREPGAHGRRLLGDSPRLDDLTEEKIRKVTTEKTEAIANTMQELDIKVDMTQLKGLIESYVVFSVSGFDDFLHHRLENPSAPKYEYWIDSDGDGQLDWETCPVVAIMVDEFKESLGVMIRYYNGDMVHLDPSNVLNMNNVLPSFIREQGGTPVTERGHAATVVNIGTWTVSYVAQLVEDLTGMTRGRIAELTRCSDEPGVFSLCNSARDYLKCDEEAVQLCSKRNHSIYLSFLMWALFFVPITYVLKMFWMRYVALAMWVSLPAFVMWYTYGYSALCAPMIPTCIAEDLLIPFYYIIPKGIRVSEALQTIPGCWNNKAIDPADCFRSCVTDQMFNYQSLSATAAQLVCELYGPSCINTRVPPWMGWLIDPGDFAYDLRYKYIAQWNFYERPVQREDELVAQRFCAVIGLVFSVPYFVIALLLLFIGLAAPLFLLRLFAAGLHVVMYMVFYSHMSSNSGI